MPTTIHLYIAADVSACQALLPAPAIAPPNEVVILPSTLQRRDDAASQVRSWLRSFGINSHLLVPEPLVVSAIGRRGTAWSAVDGESGAPPVFLPTRLATAGEVWTVSDIDTVGGRGPYILDLLARYANPRTRLALLGSRNRAALAVSLLRARPLAHHMIVRRSPALTLLATTDDPIAAELLALSLVDDMLPGNSEVTGPWEDDFVQRATEFDLGARLPSEIRVMVHGTGHALGRPMIDRIVARMGLNGHDVGYEDPK